MWLVGAPFFFWISVFAIIMSKFTTPDKIYPYTSVMFRIFFKVLFIKVTVENAEEVDKNKAYVFMPNHNSMLDVFLAGAYIPVYVNALEAESHFKWFFYGAVIKAYGQIPISRSNPRSALKSFAVAKERLAMGRSTIVFPEGHRSKTGKMLPFKKIPFRYAKDSGVDLVPIGFSGVHKLSPENSMWLRPGKITVRFGKKITAEEMKSLTAEEIMEITRERIYDLVDDFPKKNVVA